ncbi:hypothetical protein L596_019982 [Steinernema carpocapsae]|nr:hypothetical protein L596_019982 [Steinernema carpocapsae]
MHIGAPKANLSVVTFVSTNDQNIVLFSDLHANPPFPHLRNSCPVFRLIMYTTASDSILFGSSKSSAIFWITGSLRHLHSRILWIQPPVDAATRRDILRGAPPA